jgi:hypothetical protein
MVNEMTVWSVERENMLLEVFSSKERAMDYAGRFDEILLLRSWALDFESDAIKAAYERRPVNDDDNFDFDDRDLS